MMQHNLLCLRKLTLKNQPIPISSSPQLSFSFLCCFLARRSPTMKEKRNQCGPETVTNTTVDCVVFWGACYMAGGCAIGSFCFLVYITIGEIHGRTLQCSVWQPSWCGNSRTVWVTMAWYWHFLYQHGTGRHIVKELDLKLTLGMAERR